jgi:hypothetical protein
MLSVLSAGALLISFAPHLNRCFGADVSGRRRSCPGKDAGMLTPLEFPRTMLAQLCHPEEEL